MRAPAIRSALVGLALIPCIHSQGGAAADESASYGFLPVRVFAGSHSSADEVLGALREGLSARGARIVPDVVVEDALRENRIRQTESISVAAAQTLGQSTGARFLVAGTLLDHAGAPSPRFALLLRLVDTSSGRRSLSSLVSLRGEDFRGLLGLGAITESVELAREVAARILEDFGPSGWPSESELDDLGSQRPSDALAAFRESDLHLDTSARIVALPLDNRTNRGEAGRVFAEVLSHQWFRAAGVDVVENAELRATLVRLGVRSLEYLGEEDLRRIGAELGAGYFLLGSVDRYSGGTFRAGALTPEIEASARLLDVESGRIVAAGSVLRRGSDYHVVLGLGTVDDLTTLAERAALELVALMAVNE